MTIASVATVACAVVATRKFDTAGVGIAGRELGTFGDVVAVVAAVTRVAWTIVGAESISACRVSWAVEVTSSTFIDVFTDVIDHCESVTADTFETAGQIDTESVVLAYVCLALVDVVALIVAVLEVAAVAGTDKTSGIVYAGAVSNI